MSMQLLVNIIDYVISTLISLYFMRYIVEAIQNGRPFEEALMLIFGMFAAWVLNGLLGAFIGSMVAPQGKIKVTALFMEMLYGQAISVDLSC